MSNIIIGLRRFIKYRINVNVNSITHSLRDYTNNSNRMYTFVILQNPRIILLDCALEYKKAESNTNVEITGNTVIHLLIIINVLISIFPGFH